MEHFNIGSLESLKLTLAPIDYLVVLMYFLLVISIGLIMKKKGGASRKNFFLSGQNLPWWLLGTSMVATTFSIGTPLMVAGWSREAGIGKNWEWWVFVFGQMFTTFFFAKLWRRTNVFNDAGFIGIRYSGPEADFLRGFRALYMGFLMNILVLGMGLIAVLKIGTILLGIDPADPSYNMWKWGIPIFCGLVALSYSALSGFAAIIITDFIGFIVAMTGAVLIAVYTVKHPGVESLSNMVAHVRANFPEHMNFIPGTQVHTAGLMTFWVIVTYCAVRWWAQIYGGAEPGGGSHVAQRLVSARSEKDALMASMWFTVAHYAVRPLPWIITGLASLLIFPIAQFPDHEKVYLATIDFLPMGLKGIAIASLFAAFLSNTDTRLNLGASYFVNDFYKPYMARNKSDRHYIVAARVITAVQLILSYLIFFVGNDIRSLFFIYVGIGSGAGLVYILRFYWWRISAWSEIAAMSAALICMIIFRWFIYGSEASFNAHAFDYMFISLGIVTVIWVLVTLVTRPTTRNVLEEFYKRVRPAGPFWKPISTELAKEGIKSSDNLKIAFVGWLFSNPMTLGYLFGLGHLMLGNKTYGWIWMGIAAVCTIPTMWAIKKMTGPQSEKSKTIDEQIHAEQTIENI